MRRKLTDGNSIERVGPHVFAVGADEDWGVAARYRNGKKTNPEYFYFSKSTDGPYENGDEVALGPFTEAQFKAFKRK